MPVFLGFGNGGTKEVEYRISIELFKQIFESQGVYFALAFLYDSGYDREDIGKMMELIAPKRKS